jgi:hypothetical protein
MAGIVYPVVVSERTTDGHWWACTWCAAVAGARLHSGGKVPGTYREAQLLAGHGGDPNLYDGSTTEHLLRACNARYHFGWKAETLSKEARSEWLQTPGHGAILSVIAAKLPSRLRRWDPRFTGGHRVTIFTNARGHVVYLDPLAPQGYAGDEVTAADRLDRALMEQSAVLVWAPGTRG